MAYEKVPRPSTVYHLTQKGNLDSILDDGMIRRFNDTECWFCESLDKMKAYMEQTVMCKGKPYRTADGQLCHYSNFNSEAYILLKLAPIRQENAWYRRTQEQPSSSSDEVMQAEREFFPLSIGYRGDMAFQNAEVIDVPKFLAGEIVSHKELTSSELWGLLFERTEVEMAAYMRGLDHLERDELIQSAAEISAMQVCRRRLMAERKKLTRRNVLFLLQVEKPLGLISEVWMEQQNAGEGNAFSRLLAELYKQKGNGYLIDEAWCRFFKENHFLVGLSVDGTKEIHDTYRHSKNGGPTFDRVCHAAELMDTYGVEYNILTVVNQKVASEIAKIYEFYKKQGWHYQQYIACLDPLEEAHGENEYALEPKQYGRFLIELFELWYADWKNGTQPYIRQFENYVGILLGYQPEACDQRGICGIQNVVEADGSVYPCDFYMLDEYRLGNFNANQMEEINAKRKEIGFIERSLQLKESCKSCPYFTICRGGCQRNRDYDQVSGMYENYFCKSYEMFFDACLPKMKEMAETLKRR